VGDTRRFHRSFAGGEVSTELFGRVDDVRYQNGAAKMQNFIPQPQGAARRRPGLEWISSVKDATKRVRLVPFIYSPDDSVLIEMGESYFRFHLGGAPAIAGGQLIGAGAGTPNYWIPPPPSLDSVVAGDEISFDEPSNPDPVFYARQPVQLVSSGGTWPAPLNTGITYWIYSVSVGGGKVTIKLSATPTGGPISWSDAAAGLTDETVAPVHVYGDPVIYPWGIASSSAAGTPENYICQQAHLGTTTLIPGTAAGDAYWRGLVASLGGTVEIPHFYREEDLFDLTFAQSADVVTITHPNYQPSELRRLSNTNWEFKPIQFSGALPAPPQPTAITTPGRRFRIVEVELSGNEMVFRVASEHGLSDGDGIYIEGNPFSEFTAPTFGTSGTPEGPGFFTVAGAQLAYTSISASFVAGRCFQVAQYSTGIVGTADSYDGSTSTGYFVRRTPLEVEDKQVYKVTAVDANGVESDPSTELEVDEGIVLYVEGASVELQWTEVAGAASYRVYKEEAGLFGYIGQTDTPSSSAVYSFTDDNIAPDMSVTPGIRDETFDVVSGSMSLEHGDNVVAWTDHGRKLNDPVWFTGLTGEPGLLNITDPDVAQADARYFVVEPVTTDTFAVAAEPGGTAIDIEENGNLSGEAYSAACPGAVAYFEQRRMFAGTLTAPQGLWATRTGTESDLRYALPLRDEDRVSATISSRQASIIRHIVPMDQLLLLTSSAEYRVTPVNDDAITPTSISVRPQSYIGASKVTPQIVNNVAVFGAARGGHVRELGYQAQRQSFVTGDLSLRAAHLFDDYDLVDSAQSKAPHSVLWFVSSSGKLLSLTYVPEEQVGAWAQHTTGGDNDIFESVAVIPEGDEDRVYVVTNRGGLRYIERMAEQAVTTLGAALYLDASVVATNTNFVTGLTHLLGKEVTVVADGVVQTGVSIVNYPSVSVTVDHANDEIDLTAHGLVADEPVTFTGTMGASGLISGQIYYVRLAGVVDPENSFAISLTAGGDAFAIESGSSSVDVYPSARLTLPATASVVNIGLAYNSDLQTAPMSLDMPGFSRGQRINVNEVTLRVNDSGAFSVGPDEDSLVPSNPRSGAEVLSTGTVPLKIRGRWRPDGQVFIRAEGFAPLTVVEMVAEVSLGQ